MIEVLGVENARNFVKIDENSAPLQTLSAWIEEEYAEMPEKKIDDYLRSVQPMLQKKFDWCEQVCSDEERAATATYTATYAVERALPDNSNYPRFNIVISDYPPILTASEKSRIRQTLRDMVRENCAELKHAPLEVKFG
ncbi:MAG: hypothetical protein LBU39_03715 [Desulfobulbaceae bacterium]|nr:hypothetical protein [Desulfobulbaceae bacterium]